MPSIDRNGPSDALPDVSEPPERHPTDVTRPFYRGGWRHIRVKRSVAIRLALGAGLIAASILTNRSFLGWGLFVIFAVTLMPLGRARSFIYSFVPYSTVWFVFTALRALADETILAQTLTTKVPEFERWLFSGQLPTILLQDRYWGQYSPPYQLHWYDYACTAVHWSYFLIPHVVAIVTWQKNPRLFRHFLSAMTILLAVGLAIYFIIPTRPPWNAPEAGDSPMFPTAERIMTLVAVKLGGGLYDAGYKVIGESNPWAAMPSIHMAITFLLVFPAYHAGRRWGHLALAYSAAMGFSLMYLGEHYFVDIAAGVLITAYGWVAAGTWLSRVYPVSRRFFPGHSIPAPGDPSHRRPASSSTTPISQS